MISVKLSFFGLPLVFRWLEVGKDWKTCTLHLQCLIFTFRAHFKRILRTIWAWRIFQERNISWSHSGQGQVSTENLVSPADQDDQLKFDSPVDWVAEPQTIAANLDVIQKWIQIMTFWWYLLLFGNYSLAYNRPSSVPFTCRTEERIVHA